MNYASFNLTSNFSKSFSSSSTYKNHIVSKKHLDNEKKKSQGTLKEKHKDVEEDGERIETLTTMDDNTICLFCNHKSDTLHLYFQPN